MNVWSHILSYILYLLYFRRRYINIILNCFYSRNLSHCICDCCPTSKIIIDILFIIASIWHNILIIIYPHTLGCPLVGSVGVAAWVRGEGNRYKLWWRTRQGGCQRSSRENRRRHCRVGRYSIWVLSGQSRPIRRHAARLNVTPPTGRDKIVPEATRKRGRRAPINNALCIILVYDIGPCALSILQNL